MDVPFAADQPQAPPPAPPRAPPRTPDDGEPRRRSVGERLLSIVLVPGRLIGALFVPDRYAPWFVAAGRYFAPLVAAMACAVFAAWAISSRLDMAAPQRPKPGEGGGPGMRGGGPPPGAQGGGGGGPQPLASDREVKEELTKAHKVATMGLYARALVMPGVTVLFLAIGFWIAVRYVGGRPTVRDVAAAVALAQLPWALEDLIRGVAALANPAIAPDQVDTLARLELPFNLPAELTPIGVALFVWGGVILTFGLATAARFPRWKAAVTAFAAFALVQMKLLVSLVMS